jgi:hypothetical protein
MMSDEKLRAWIVHVEAVPYVTASLNRPDHFMGVVSIQVIGDGTRAIIAFKGSAPYVENQICSILKNVVTDEGWPSEASVPKEKKPSYY